MKRALAIASALCLVSTSAYAQSPFGGSAPPDEPAAPIGPPAETPPAAADAPAEPVVVAKPKPPMPVGIRADGAWSPHRLFALPVNGADVGLAVGPRPQPEVAVWGASRLFLGSTANGLSVWSFSLGAEVEGILGRFRIGGGVGGFLLGVKRAVRNETLLSWGPDIRAATRFDVIQDDDFALFLRAAVGGGYDVYGHSAFWGPSLGAGLELDLGVPRGARGAGSPTTSASSASRRSRTDSAAAPGPSSSSAW
jgi:hypothetical protein